MGAFNVVMNFIMFLVGTALFAVILYNNNSESVAEERNANVVNAFRDAIDNSKNIIDKRGGVDPEGLAAIVGEVWTAGQSIGATWLSGILVVLLFVNLLCFTELKL